MVLIARISAVIILLYTNAALVIALNPIGCWLQPPSVDHPIMSNTDCQPAFDSIPNGTITFDGIRQKPLAFHLPPAARQNNSLPAIFRSGNCVIGVSEDNRKASYPRLHAASDMYFKVWPAVREAVRRIRRECFTVPPNTPLETNAGMTLVDVTLEGENFEFVVRVSGMDRFIRTRNGPVH